MTENGLMDKAMRIRARLARKDPSAVALANEEKVRADEAVSRFSGPQNVGQSPLEEAKTHKATKKALSQEAIIKIKP